MHSLPKLDYGFDALEPYIDKETMEIHYGKHHQAYINNLNDALAQYPDLQKLEMEDLLKNSATISEEIRTKVINNGGGHLNHSLFWKFMGPKESSVQGELKNDIGKVFGDFETFKEKFSGTALTHFGSGWGWLALGSDGLEVISTPNQNPITYTNAFIGTVTCTFSESGYYDELITFTATTNNQFVHVQMTPIGGLTPTQTMQLNYLFTCFNNNGSGNFYPANITRQEIEIAARKNPSLLSPYTIVKKSESGKLLAVQFHDEYQKLLKPL